MDLYTILFQGFTCIAQGILQTGFSGWYTNKQPKIRHYAACILLLYLGSCAGDFFQSFFLSTLLNLLIIYSLNRFLLGDGRSHSGLTAVLAVSIVQFSYGIFNSLTSVLLPYLKPGGWMLAGPLASALSIALCLGCYLLAARHFSVAKDLYGPYSFTLTVPVLFLFSIGFYIVNTVYGNVTVLPPPAAPKKHAEMLVLQALGLCSLFSLLYAYRKLYESFQAKSRLALLEQETRAQRAYVDEAKSRYEQTRAFRHDIRNHLSVLSGLLGTGQAMEAAHYLKKLEAASVDLSFPFQTGRPVIDILLSSKSEMARRQKTVMDCSVSLPQLGKVDDLDLCVVFSNAVDNALHACARADANSRLIRITGKHQGDFFLLEFENSFRPDPEPAPPEGSGAVGSRAGNRDTGCRPESGDTGCRPESGAAGCWPESGAAGFRPESEAVGFRPESGAAGCWLESEAAGFRPESGAVGCRKSIGPGNILPGVGLANIQAVAEKYGGAMTYEYHNGRFYLDVLLNIS